MQTFLDQPDATFYHITTLENWTNIQNTGLNSRSGKIFVSRVGELPVLLAIAIEQLPEIYTTAGVVFLKIPQSKNQIKVEEVIPDNQACVEWTQPFQNIILRNTIPAENLELMMLFNLSQPEEAKMFLINYFTQIASFGRKNYLNQEIFQRASKYKY